MNTAALAAGLLVALILLSLVRWIELIARWWRGEALLATDTLQDQAATDNSASTAVRPWGAMLVAGLWVSVLLVGRLIADWQGIIPEANASGVPASAFAAILCIAILALFLFGSGRLTPRQAGLQPRSWGRSLSLGGEAAVVAALPTFLILIATMPFRSRENQHPLLRLVAEQPGWGILALLAITVVVLAPLSEELLFRVTLQGGLRRFASATYSIGVTAGLFAIMHGWRDAIPLIPLALILGYVYDRRNDYLAIVTTHGLFNGMNLLMAVLTLPAAPPLP